MTKWGVVVGAAVLCLGAISGSAAAKVQTEPFKLVVEGSYRVHQGEGGALARAIALYRAKRKAVSLAGAYFAGSDAMSFSGPRKEEIYSLATEEVVAKILEERDLDGGGRHYVRMEADVNEGIFAMAGMRALKEENSQLSLPFREEMEQETVKALLPAEEIARAYGLIQNGHWKLAGIYLENLGEKYPYLGELYLAKAMVYAGTHREKEMREAMVKACSLESREACEDLKAFSATDDSKTFFFQQAEISRRP